MKFDFKTALRDTPLCYEPCDAVKFCYQAAYGAEHLLSDKTGAKAYFDKEYGEITAREGQIAEQISQDYFRVNLAVWKQKNLPSDWLFNMFYLSAGQTEKRNIEPLIEIAREIVSDGHFPFNKKEFDDYLSRYDGNAVHHSEACRKNASPSYRVVGKKYVRLIPLLEKLCRGRVMAIDGRAAAGKSTAAQDLSDITGAGLIHMDDFFLPVELRTEARLSEAGGNVDYERFAKEVLPFINKGTFSYTRFDCKKMELCEKVYVKEAEHYIVEGSYSHHPHFENYADIRVFCDITPDKQSERIEKRNGKQMLEIFKSKWIPMEETYFKVFAIKEKADIVTVL